MDITISASAAFSFGAAPYGATTPCAALNGATYTLTNYTAQNSAANGAGLSAFLKSSSPVVWRFEQPGWFTGVSPNVTLLMILTIYCETAIPPTTNCIGEFGIYWIEETVAGQPAFDNAAALRLYGGPLNGQFAYGTDCDAGFYLPYTTGGAYAGHVQPCNGGAGGGATSILVTKH